MFDRRNSVTDEHDDPVSPTLAHGEVDASSPDVFSCRTPEAVDGLKPGKVHQFFNSSKVCQCGTRKIP